MSDIEVSRVLRSIRNDLGFLVDARVIDDQLYDEIDQKLPRRWTSGKSNTGKKTENSIKDQSIEKTGDSIKPNPVAVEKNTLVSKVASIAPKFNDMKITPSPEQQSLAGPPRGKNVPVNKSLAKTQSKEAPQQRVSTPPMVEVASPVKPQYEAIHQSPQRFAPPQVQPPAYAPPPGLGYAQALYDYNSADTGDLSIKKVCAS